MNTPTPDNAAREAFAEVTGNPFNGDGYSQWINTREILPIGTKLVPAATVAALEAEVATARDRMLEMERQRDDYLNREWVATKRADAAERRVGELEKLMAAARRAIGDHHAPNDCYATGPLTGDAFLDLVQCPACAFLDQYANSTKVAP